MAHRSHASKSRSETRLPPEEDPEFQIAPMIDILLVLLVFFMSISSTEVLQKTEGINLPQSEWTPDAIAARFAEIDDVSKARALQGAFEQTQKYVAQAAARAGIKL